MKKNKDSQYILWTFFVIYLIWATVSLLKKEPITIDRFTIAAFLLFFLYLSKKYIFSPLAATLTGLIFMPHSIGISGYYAHPIFNYHPDWIIHSLSAIFAVIAILNFMLQNFNSKNFLKYAIMALCITITIGAVIEVSEYFGFLYFGIGEGYLGFGDGDNSKNFGPWENSSLDSTFNLLGALVGIFIYWTMNLVFIKKKIF